MRRLQTHLPALVLLVPAALLAGASVPTAARAQSLADLTHTPEDVAALFLSSVRAIRWSAATQFIADETLVRFHEVVTMLSDGDTTGRTRRYLSDADGRPFRDLPTQEVFGSAVGTVIDGMPGLMHALFNHDDEVIGHVQEGPDTAYVVYRTVERLGGAVPEVRVMETVHTSTGWRVAWCDELAILETALRGVPQTRPPPPSPPRP